MLFFKLIGGIVLVWLLGAWRFENSKRFGRKMEDDEEKGSRRKR